ncbi:multiple epidermal growth factor-like domains protein 11 [Anabrus simplex]|uniref:multiple epidermal growth factor-like domains protein 11 n=1 Tax=Anabrus simplex TaxID=316456 RepID=UPI0035A3A04B
MRGGPYLLLLVAGTLGVGRGLDGQLGSPCHPSGRCNVRFSECQDNICRCSGTGVPSAYNNRCLPVADGLKGYCEENVQCTVPHSHCRRFSKECECVEGYVMARDRSVCLPVSRLGEPCLERAQCKESTECSPSLGVCVCRGISYEYDGKCVTDHISNNWELTVVTVSPAAGSQLLAHNRWLLCIALAALVHAGVR